MGLSTKQVSGDHQGLLIDWGGGGQAMMQSSGAAELSKPPSVRRHQPPTQQQSEPPLKCPRCASTNTKFCYYNNYNKSQPRHFCKACKRHWTKGGTLRNVPVGGGRKNKRPKISNPTPSTAATSAAGVRQEEKQQHNFPLSTASIIGDHQKSMSTILYQSLIPTSSPSLHEATRDCINANIGVNGGADSTISTGLNINQNTEFHEFTSLSTFDHMNASLGPTCYHSLNMFDHYPGNLDSMEESTITTVNNNIPSSSSSAPLWTGPNTTSSLELPNYWNWNEIDVLTSSDHLNISWDDHDDDAEVKP